ncbi:hypothetical protein AHAS_Ahas13G0291000 [Arachis hypogaea]
MPSTHSTEVPADMVVLIWSVLEGKELYLPQLIKKYMYQANIRGNLPFPYLVRQLAQRAEVPWEQGDEAPAVHGKEKVMPWGDWFGDRPVAWRRAQAAIAVATEPTTSSAAAGPSTPSRSAPSSTS